MEDLPPLPASGAPSRASSRQSSVPDLSETHLYIREFIHETSRRLNFSPTQLPALDDNQLSGLSDGETILVPLSCSALNALASMTRQLDTITTQLGTIQSIVATLPTNSALDSKLAPINASLRDLSQRVSAAPAPPVQAPTRAAIPPAVPTARPTPLPAQPRARPRAPPPANPSPASFDPDIPRYDPDTRAFYGDPRAYADKFPDCWEANPFREGKYPDPTTFISGHLAPDCPKTQPSYAQAASKGPSKGKKVKNSLTAAKVASASNLAPATQAPRSLPTAERRFFVPRSSPSEHPQASLIAATFPDIAARVLRDANCILPLAVTTKVNDRGSVTLLVSDPATPAAAFAPYFDALSSQLNKSFPVGESPWLPFRLAPNEAQLAIHSLPLAFLPEDPEELLPCLAESILNSKNIRILAARYLNPDARSREGKTATSVIVSVHPGDVPTMASSIRLFSSLRTLEAPTLPIGTRSVRTAGDSATSPPGAPPPLLFAPSAPSTTPEQCTSATTPLALDVAALRLLLAVVLPRHRAAPIAEAPTLRLTGIVTPARLRPLSGVHPLPTRSFSRPAPATKWTRPPTTETSRRPLHPPAPSSRRFRWLLQGLEGQRYFRPL